MTKWLFFAPFLLAASAHAQLSQSGGGGVVGAITSGDELCANDAAGNVKDCGLVPRNTIRVITAAGGVTVAPTDLHVCVAKTTGAATAVTLPAAPAVGLPIVVEDCKGDAATNNITITPAAGNIDGSATFVINTNWGSWTGIYTGTIWKTTAVR